MIDAKFYAKMTYINDPAESPLPITTNTTLRDGTVSELGGLGFKAGYRHIRLMNITHKFSSTILTTL
jgi:hypothetical protein